VQIINTNLKKLSELDGKRRCHLGYELALMARSWQGRYSIPSGRVFGKELTRIEEVVMVQPTKKEWVV
jgi:hypothetical protein